MWNRVARAYDILIVALAWFAGAAIMAIFVVIVYDVTLRTLGFRPPRITSAGSEYALLYFTMAAAPYLVRHKGHVFIETGRALLPAALRRLAERATYVICITVCALLFYFSLDLTVEAIALGEVEIRSISMPRWFLFAPLPPSFLLMGIEFARFLAGRDSLYVRTEGDQESF